ncbi:hypothetical protein E4U55_004913 [Claviceps digitariae]|nr:hypothetical protein E4U55_004913 [Claviceps digitariae]
MPTNRVAQADEPPRSPSSLEIEPKRQSSCLSFASVLYSSTSESELPIVVPPRSPLRNPKTLFSSPASSVDLGVQKSSSSIPGAQDSAAGLHSSYHVPTSDPSCNAVSLPGPAEVGRRPPLSELDVGLEEGEEYAGSPIPVRSGPESSSNVSERQVGTEQVDQSIEGPTSPKPPHKHRPVSLESKNTIQVAESMTSDTTSSKIRSFLFQFRRGPEPASKRGADVAASLVSAPPRSPVQPEMKRQRRSVAGSESSGCSVHTPTSAEYALDANSSGASGCLASINTGLAAESHNADSALSTTRKGGARKRNPGKQELPYTLAVVIPDGKLFEDELELLDLLSI